jgi:1-acyl-sn-glycerol-3-phosphate acyltransferase
LHVVCRLVASAVFHVRVSGRQHEPLEGGVLVLANHQSHFDPVLVGLACRRRMNYLARETLFRFAPLRWLMQSLDAIPIDREGLGFGGLKETLRRLKQGEMVLIFPEGTRTRDGQIAPLKPGFCAVARRGAVRLLPVAIDGAFDAWPRSAVLPRRAVIHIVLGKPLEPDEVRSLSDEQLQAAVAARLAQCHAEARAGRLRANGRQDLK